MEKLHDVYWRTWHRAYCRWIGHQYAGHKVRAAVWGWVADRIAEVG